MRSLLAAAGLLVLAGPAFADINYAIETDTYRFGGTYATVSAETPAQCAHTCASHARCFAWSHASVADSFAAACELKQNAGLVEPRPGFTSGISASHAAKFTDILIAQPGSGGELAGGPRTHHTGLRPPRQTGVGAGVDAGPTGLDRQPRRVTNWSFVPEGSGQSRDYFPNSSETRPAYTSGPDRPREQPQY